MACPLLMPECLPYAKAKLTGTLLLRPMPGRPAVCPGSDQDNSTKNPAGPQPFVQHGMAGLAWV
jgi:hypothetical protein